MATQETTDQVLFLISAVASALVFIGTVAALVAGTPQLGELLVPGALLGLLALVLGFVARHRGLMVAGAAAMAFPAIIFLVADAVPGLL